MVQVNSAWNAGDYSRAYRNSIIAHNLNMASIVSGAIITLIIILLRIITYFTAD